MTALLSEPALPYADNLLTVAGGWPQNAATDTNELGAHFILTVRMRKVRAKRLWAGAIIRLVLYLRL